MTTFTTIHPLNLHPYSVTIYFSFLFIIIPRVWSTFFRNVIGIREGFGVQQQSFVLCFPCKDQITPFTKKSLERCKVEKLTPGWSRSPSPQHGSLKHHCFSHHHNSPYVSCKGSGEGPVLTAIMCNKLCLVGGSSWVTYLDVHCSYPNKLTAVNMKSFRATNIYLVFFYLFLFTCTCDNAYILRFKNLRSQWNVLVFISI